MRGVGGALVIAAVALFGLMAMHGWGTHVGGPGHPIAAADAVVHSEVAGSSGSGVRPDQSPAALAHAVDVVAAPAGCTEGCSDGHVVWAGVCLAVLCGLLVGCVLLLFRRTAPLPRTMLPAWPYFVPMESDRDPPDLLRLCVMRC